MDINNEALQMQNETGSLLAEATSSSASGLGAQVRTGTPPISFQPSPLTRPLVIPAQVDEIARLSERVSELEGIVKRERRRADLCQQHQLHQLQCQQRGPVLEPCQEVLLGRRSHVAGSRS